MPAAIAAAHCAVLGSLLRTVRAAVEGGCRAAIDAIPSGAGKDAGIAAGERAAQELLARRAEDGALAPDVLRPFTVPGRYVPTAPPASPQWGERRPWLMASPSELRPAAPPALASERWARDYAEVKALGGAASTRRSIEQTAVARFWETTHPVIYHALLRGYADRPGRDLIRNTRLFAAYAQAIDDAMIATFEAKYHHAFWRPVTAIRNGDQDGNEATERDAGWTSFVPTPMHPEYPCAHCVQAGVLAAVVEGDNGTATLPELVTASPSAAGAKRRWTSTDAFVREVADARVWDGVHYRFSSEAGVELGRQVGALAVRRFLSP